MIRAIMVDSSQCDGSNPCSRCRTDNSICVFGERKRSYDKIYPKGYVEMLEQQQEQLVGGLQVLYDMVINEKGWKGAPLKKWKNGYPLTHDILERLRLLKTGPAADSDMYIEGGFEEDLETLRKRLAAKGDGLAQTDSTESDYHSQTPYPDRQSSPQDFFTNVQFPPLNHLPPPTPPRQYLHGQRSTNHNQNHTNSAHQENSSRRSLDGAMLQLQPNQRSSSSWAVQLQHPQDPSSYEDPIEYVPYQHDQAYRCHQNLPGPSNPRRLTSLWPNDNNLVQFGLNSGK